MLRWCLHQQVRNVNANTSPNVPHLLLANALVVAMLATRYDFGCWFPMENWVHYLFQLAAKTHSVGVWRTRQPRIGEYSRLERMHVRNILSTSTCMLMFPHTVDNFFGPRVHVPCCSVCLFMRGCDFCWRSPADAATERVCVWRLVLDAEVLVVTPFLKSVPKMSFLIVCRRTSMPNVVDFGKTIIMTNTRWNFKKAFISSSYYHTFNWLCRYGMCP